MLADSDDVRTYNTTKLLSMAPAPSKEILQLTFDHNNYNASNRNIVLRCGGSKSTSQLLCVGQQPDAFDNY